MSRRLTVAGLCLCAIMIPSARSIAQAQQDPHVQVLRSYQQRIQAHEQAAGFVKFSLDQLHQSMAGLIEARQMTELAASIPRGRQVEVYVLYRRLVNGEGERRDVLQEVSPHPFPPFLRQPGAFVVSRKFVTGNGAYLGFGLPPYPGAQELVPYAGGQPGMRAAVDDAETARRYAQWNLYKLTIELWKERRFEKPPTLYTRVGDAASGQSSFAYQPRAGVLEDVRESLNNLEAELDEIDRGFEEHAREFEVYVSQRPATSDAIDVQRETGRLREKLRLMRNFLDAMGSVGVPAHTRDDVKFYRVLQFLSGQLRQRADAYDTEQARHRENQRRVALEQALREAAARRTAWDYLKAVAGDACDEPQQVLSLHSRGDILGVELSRSDFTYFFIQDTTRHITLMDIVRGEYRMGPNGCQKALLRSMLEQRAPMSIADLAHMAAQYRSDHPGLLQRIERGLQALGRALVQIVSGLGTASSSSSGSPSSGSSSGSVGRERTERSAGTHADTGRNINLSRPDFDMGSGSTLGR